MEFSLSSIGVVVIEMTRMLGRLAQDIMILAFVGGCASYTATPAPIPIAEAMPAWRTEGAVTVGSDPYTDPDRQLAVFNAELTKVRVLAIQILVRNEGPSRLSLQRADITLDLPDGTQLPPAQKTIVVYLASGPPATVPWPDDLPTPPAIGAMNMPVVIAKNRDLQDRLEDYRRKELKDAVLSQHESINGFVYFIAPVTETFSDATLSVPIIDIDAARRILFRLPLSGLRFNANTAQPKQEPKIRGVKR